MRATRVMLIAAALACSVLPIGVGSALAAGPPSVGVPRATNIQGISAVLEAGVNPQGLATAAHFEYVSQAGFDTDGFADAGATPDGAFGAGTSERAATAALSGLSPDTTYHFRLHATNSAGPVNSTEATFTTTHGFGFLPGTAGFDASLNNQNGTLDKLAGTHPFSFQTSVNFNRAGEFDAQPGVPFSDGDLRDLHIALPPGLLANPTAVSECPAALFHTPRSSPYEESRSGESCPDKSQVGVVAIHSSLEAGNTRYFGIYNLTPPPGAPQALGFAPFGIPIVLTPHIREGDAGLTFSIEDLPQRLNINGIGLSMWGVPWDLGHDSERGNCLNESDPASYYGELATLPGPENNPPFHAGTCTIGDPAKIKDLIHSFLTLPTSCEGPLHFAISARSWQQPALVESSVESHDGEGHPANLEACNKTLATAKVQLTTDSAASRSGLVFNLSNNDGGGILNPGGIARPAIKTAVVSLPEGLTINPSVGAGLGVCSEADLSREALDSAPGAGCPNPSKVGDVVIEGLLGLPEPVQGSLFIAKPYENPFGSLLAVYMVARSPQRGLFVKSLGKIEADPKSGRLVATFENLPRLLYTHFTLTFREGQRSVVISPPSCGSYPMALDLASWAQPGSLLHDSSAFNILHGRDGSACPSGGLPPFNPALEAGSLNSNAGSYTPFYLHMTRSDVDQEITSYSATFPPGLLARLSGVSKCSDAAIEAAKAKTSSAEEAVSSCPASSQIGHTVVGEGVGQTLAYATGGLYLAGPYHGSPISVASITAARVGPFDLGTVVVRSAIRIDTRTAQASIDAHGSDPIPHILKGIPIHVRDIRVYVDRPNFTLNPTSCDVTSTLSTLTGAGADFFSSADDVAANALDRYQDSDCTALGFKPSLSLSLRGGVRRGDFPSLRAIYTPRPGNANIARATVALPHTEFLAQGHIREICTLHQFELGACPPSSIYGHATAFTPLLDQPLSGPVYLRSSATHPLPDMVVALRGPGSVAIDLEGRVDSVKGGGLRASFEVLPDAPVSKFVLTLQGAKKGLLENSANLCAAPSFATARFVGHNNQGEALAVPMQSDCAKRHRKAHHHSKHRRH